MGAAEDAYAEAEDLIAKAKADGARVLALSLPDLAVLPPEIGTLSELWRLDLEFTKVTDLAPLRNLRALQALYLKYAPVENLGPLAKLSALKWLDLDDSKVTELSPLSGLRLEHLSLNRTPITDISPLADMDSLETLWLQGSDIRDLRPLRGLHRLAEAPAGDGLQFDDTPATLSNPRLAEIAAIKDAAERAQALFDHLDRTAPPPHDPLLPVTVQGDKFEISATNPTELEQQETLKRRLHDDLRGLAHGLATASGNRFFRTAARARALVGQLESEFEDLDLLGLHLAISDLRDLNDLGREDEDGEPFTPEVKLALGDVLRRGPGLTLGNPDVDLLEERANRHRGEPPVKTEDAAAQNDMSKVVTEAVDLMGERLRALETAVLESPSAEGRELQVTANHNILWRMAALAGAVGVNVTAGMIVHSYGVAIEGFVTANWPILIAAAETYGSAFAGWFVSSMSQVREFAALARHYADKIRR